MINDIVLTGCSYCRYDEGSFKALCCILILQALNVIGYQLGDASKVV